jgi:PhnB protein
MAHLVAYLTFDGNCKEAMEFYTACLGGKLDLMTVGSSPMAAQMPGMGDQVMHSRLVSGNMILMASDSMGRERQEHGNSVSLCLVCDSKTEVEGLFSRLSAGGQITSPLKEEFFGTYGAVADKFGFRWMLQYGTGQMQ